MSGWPRWASVAPSHRLTSAWTIDCGCTTTPMSVVGRAEEVVGLDDLEALVHEGRRVDRDLAAHRPGRVLEGVLDGDAGQLGARPAPERAARRRDGEPHDGARPLARDQLVQRGVLGVHRDQPGAGRLAESRDQLAADHERLLVGQRDVDALAEGDDRRAQAGRADDRVEHEVGVGLRDQTGEPLRPGEDLAVRPLLGGARGRVGVGQGDPAHGVRARLRDEGLPAAVGAQADELEGIRGAAHDVERLGADRAGGAEDEEPLHARLMVGGGSSVAAKRQALSAGGRARRP